jgi:Cu(I)/Ag(I) efflux system protein CusF
MNIRSTSSVIVMFALASMPAILHSASAAEPQQGMKMPMPATPPKEMSYHAKGVVKSIDPAAQTIVVSHEPIAALKWPAMTMGFKVRDKASLAKVAVGKAVSFELVKEGPAFVITSIQ